MKKLKFFFFIFIYILYRVVRKKPYTGENARKCSIFNIFLQKLVDIVPRDQGRSPESLNVISPRVNKIQHFKKMR